MLLYMIRHGETGWNQQKRYFGVADIKLNPVGIRQAKRLSLKFKKMRIDCVYSSDSKRASDFAELAFPGRMINKTPGLREMNFGVFEGKTHTQLMDAYPDIYSNWLKDSYNFHIPGGEKLQSFRNRVLKAMGSIIRKNRGNTVAVVTHGGPIRIILNNICGSGNIHGVMPKIAGVNIIKYTKGKASFVLLKGKLQKKHG